jgi:hypothetical protein
MKKWIVIVAILICCVLYTLVRFSKPQDRNETNQAENPPIEVQADTGDTNKAPLAESPGSTVPPTQVEAITKALREFQSCLKDGKDEQAWELTSQYFRSRVVGGGFEKFKEKVTGEMSALATATVHPESAIVIDDRVGLLVTSPSFEDDLYLFFIEEDGQWKLDIGQEARDVPR